MRASIDELTMIHGKQPLEHGFECLCHVHKGSQAVLYAAYALRPIISHRPVFSRLTGEHEDRSRST